MTEPANGEATISGANQSFNKVKTALTTVFGVPQTILAVTHNLSTVTKPNANEALNVEITFKANSGFEFDTTITEGTAYTYDAKAKTATLTLKITPAQAWE